VPRASARGSPTGVLSGGHRHEPRAWGGPPTPGNRRSIIAAEIGQYAARLQRDDRAVAFDAAYAARGGPAEARRPRRSRTPSRAILSITQCARTPPEIDQTEDALTAAVERILAGRHRVRTLDEYVAEDTAQRIDAVLGPGVTRPRDLAEYDALPRAARLDVPSEPDHGQDQDPAD